MKDFQGRVGVGQNGLLQEDRELKTLRFEVPSGGRLRGPFQPLQGGDGLVHVLHGDLTG